MQQHMRSFGGDAHVNRTTRARCYDFFGVDVILAKGGGGRIVPIIPEINFIPQAIFGERYYLKRRIAFSAKNDILWMVMPRFREDHVGSAAHGGGARRPAGEFDERYAAFKAAAGMAECDARAEHCITADEKQASARIQRPS